MARTVTLAELRQNILDYGGVSRTAAWTSSVLNVFVNDAIAELHGMIKKKRDDRLVTSTTLTTAVGVETVSLPTTFLELRKLEIVDASEPSGYRRLRAGSLDASHRFSTLVGKRYRYRLQGGNLVLMPTPQAVETLRLYFIPYATVLTSDSDTLDGYNGYEQVVYALGWKRCLISQDLPTADLEREIGRLFDQVSSDADGRDAEPFYLNDPAPGFYDDEVID